MAKPKFCYINQDKHQIIGVRIGVYNFEFDVIDMNENRYIKSVFNVPINRFEEYIVPFIKDNFVPESYDKFVEAELNILTEE